MIKLPRSGAVLMRSDPKIHGILGAISDFGDRFFITWDPPFTEAYAHLEFFETQKSALDCTCNTGRQNVHPKMDFA